MIRCLSCRAETTNGLALCAMCIRSAELKLQYIGIYYRNLSRWSPGNAKSSRPVPGSREPARPNPGTGDRVGRALDEANNMLTTRAREYADDRPSAPTPMQEMTTATAADVVVTLCTYFAEHLTSISTLNWAGDLVHDLDHHEVTLRTLTEQVAPGWYAGGCRRCGSGTYVVPGLTWVTCGGCGATTYARDHLDVVLDEARGWAARPKALAEAIVALVDTEPSVEKLNDRIRRWSHLGWLEAVRRTDERGRPIGIKRYRLGDVLDLALGHTDAPTRPKRTTAV